MKIRLEKVSGRLLEIWDFHSFATLFPPSDTLLWPFLGRFLTLWAWRFGSGRVVNLFLGARDLRDTKKCWKKANFPMKKSYFRFFFLLWKIIKKKYYFLSFSCVQIYFLNIFCLQKYFLWTFQTLFGQFQLAERWNTAVFPVFFWKIFKILVFQQVWPVWMALNKLGKFPKNVFGNKKILKKNFKAHKIFGFFY